MAQLKCIRWLLAGFYNKQIMISGAGVLAMINLNQEGV